MAILTLSRQSGSFGTQIARSLAETLKYRFLDKISLDKALAGHGVPPESVEKYDEKKPSFWEIFSSERGRYLHFLKTVICSFAREGDGIVLGRGGQVLLAGIPGVYHVRVIAPLPTRIERVKEAYRCDARHAEQIIRHGDLDRTGFHRYFFNVNWEECSLYDLVLNTRTVSVAAASELLRAMIRLCDAKELQKARERRLGDLCLKQEVETAILFTEKIQVKFLETEARDGVVTLNGTVSSRDALARCEETARAVAGVKRVENNIFYSAELYGYLPHT